MDALQLMHMDFANFTIQAFRPEIQRQSIEYEKQKFKDFLATQEGNYFFLSGIFSNKLFLGTLN